MTWIIAKAIENQISIVLPKILLGEWEIQELLKDQEPFLIRRFLNQDLKEVPGVSGFKKEDFDFSKDDLESREDEG